MLFHGGVTLRKAPDVIAIERERYQGITREHDSTPGTPATEDGGTCNVNLHETPGEIDAANGSLLFDAEGEIP
jgi:hypothetical protein